MKFLIGMVIVLGLVIVSIVNKPVEVVEDNSKWLDRMERECPNLEDFEGEDSVRGDTFDFLCSNEALNKLR